MDDHGVADLDVATRRSRSRGPSPRSRGRARTGARRRTSPPTGLPGCAGRCGRAPRRRSSRSRRAARGSSARRSPRPSEPRGTCAAAQPSCGDLSSRDSEPATDRGTCRRWSPATAPSAMPSGGTARPTAMTGVPSPVTNGGRVVGRVDTRARAAARARARRRARTARRARGRIRDESSSRDWRATSALRWNSARSASSSPRVSPGNASENPRRRVDRGVDLRARVVVLELDSTPSAHPGTRSDRGPGVGGHQEREVRRALRRRKPQAHRHIARIGHDAGADEAERGDRLVELRVVDRPERSRTRDARFTRRPLRFPRWPARRPGRAAA